MKCYAKDVPPALNFVLIKVYLKETYYAPPPHPFFSLLHICCESSWKVKKKGKVIVSHTA